MKTTYTTSKALGLVVLFIGAIGWGIAVYSSPAGFQIDAVVLTLAAILIYIFLDVMWGTSVSVEDTFVIRTDNFFMKKRLAITDIDQVRYQPTYGVGQEASSLYIFKKGHGGAVFTMTNLWFGEKQLGQFARDLRASNPQIQFDDEARALMLREEKASGTL